MAVAPHRAGLRRIAVWVDEPFRAGFVLHAEEGAVLYVNTRHVATTGEHEAVAAWGDEQLASGVRAVLLGL